MGEVSGVVHIVSVATRNTVPYKCILVRQVLRLSAVMISLVSFKIHLTTTRLTVGKTSNPSWSMPRSTCWSAFVPIGRHLVATEALWRG